jgi:uncharacterized damage-inducible protein DinB
MDIDTLRYPVGPWDGTMRFTKDTRAAALARLGQLPLRLREAVRGLEDSQLDTPYRRGGWTVRQVVHHLADSHMNGIVRTKLALTEDGLVIKPYDENAWAQLPDAKLPIEHSLVILDGLHPRWARVFEEMNEADFGRTFMHPEHRLTMTLDYQLHHYAWHSDHHVGHVASLRARQGW